MSEVHRSLSPNAWCECCPWLGLVRALSLALNVQSLLLASAGVLASMAGWWILGFLLFNGPAVEPADEDHGPGLQQSLDSIGSWPVPALRGWREHNFHPGGNNESGSPGEMSGSSTGEFFLRAISSGPVFGVWQSMATPFTQVIWYPSASLPRLAYFVVGGLWTLLVWAFFGSTISRSAAMQVTREERPALTQLFAFSGRRLKSYFTAPLLPLITVLAISLVMALFLGLPARWDATVWIAGILWGLALAGGMLMTLLLLGLFAGWPLMWATISSEGSDAFDALSRSYAYTFQRPLHYLFYALFAAVLGAIGWLVVELFADGIVRLTFWSISWGTDSFVGQDVDVRRIDHIRHIAGGNVEAETTLLWFGARAIGLWGGLVRVVELAFAFSFFWSATTMIYLLLRHDVDQVELDEVYTEEQEEVFGLPPISTDSAGVPGVSEDESSTAGTTEEKSVDSPGEANKGDGDGSNE